MRVTLTSKVLKKSIPFILSDHFYSIFLDSIEIPEEEEVLSLCSLPQCHHD